MHTIEITTITTTGKTSPLKKLMLRIRLKLSQVGHTHMYVLSINHTHTPSTCHTYTSHFYATQIHILMTRYTRLHHVHTCMLTQSPPHTLTASNSDSTYFTAGFFDGNNGAGRHFSLSYQDITFSAPDTLQTTEQFRTITNNYFWLRCKLHTVLKPVLF